MWQKYTVYACMFEALKPRIIRLVLSTNLYILISYYAAKLIERRIIHHVSR